MSLSVDLDRIITLAEELLTLARTTKIRQEERAKLAAPPPSPRTPPLQRLATSRTIEAEPADRLISIKEAAELLGVGRQTVMRWMDKETSPLKRVRIGPGRNGSVRVSLSAVNGIMAGEKQP